MGLGALVQGWILCTEGFWGMIYTIQAASQQQQLLDYSREDESLWEFTAHYRHGKKWR